MDFSSGRKLDKEGKESMASSRVHASSHCSSLLCFSDGEYNHKRRESKHDEYKTHSMGNIYSRLSKNGLNAQGRVRGNEMNAPIRARENGLNSPIGTRENGVARVKDDRESVKRDWCRSPSLINSRSVDVDKELGEISSGSSAEDVGHTFNSLSNGCSEVRKRDLTRKRKSSCSPNTEDDRPLSVDEGKAGEIIETPNSSDKEDVFVLPNIAASRWADVDSPCNGQDRKRARLSSDRGGPDETDDSTRPNIAVSRWVDIDGPCKYQEKDRVRISSVLSGGGCNSLSSDSQESIICQLDGLQVSSLCSDSDGGQAGGSCGAGKIEPCNDCEFDHRQSLDLDREDVFENEFCGSESHVILPPATRVSPCLSAVPVARRIDMLQGCRSVDEFKKLNRINEGTYGIVYRARDIKSGEVVALKKVKMERERDGFPMSALREINILLSLHHPCVVNVKEVVVGSNDLDDIFMVMEYMEHDLKGFMESMKQPFSLSEIKSLMLQLLEGVSYLHDNWVLHRDLKTSNLLLNNKGDLKMCDFGMARQYGSPLKTYTHMVVTLWYRAPELLLGAKNYSTAVDMWSVGCIMAELLAKEPLFRGKSEIDQLDKIFRTLGTPNEKIWPDFVTLKGAKCNFVKQPYNKLREKFPAVSFSARPTLSEAGFDLINHLLTYDPDKRISSEEALNHEWFRELPLPKSKEHYVDAFTSE